jgi:N6-L-threonylcarbamoyladenine synthase
MKASVNERRRVRVLGIETSCDETAVAVLEDGYSVRSNLIASQVDVHERFGGVVPEVAARAHLEALNPLMDEALERAGCRFEDLDGVAVTVGPGLVGALLVGMAAAKAVAFASGAALIGVNHLEGHIYANFLEHGAPEPPYVCLVVSGGHTMLVHMAAAHRYEVLGQTVDDAAGEAFDKIARFIGLGFPGGPALDALARDGDPDAIAFPRSMAASGDYAFSLSGLKTAVLRYVRGEREAGREVDSADLAASFQEAIVDVQVAKTIAAAREKQVGTVLLGGGVVANSRLRERMLGTGEEAGIRVLFPSLELCTDNAAMIACAGSSRLERGERTSFEIGADPGLELAS